MKVQFELKIKFPRICDRLIIYVIAYAAGRFQSPIVAVVSHMRFAFCLCDFRIYGCGLFLNPHIFGKYADIRGNS